MATLALRPTLPMRPRSGSNRDHRKHRERDAQPTVWRTIAATAGSIALAFFAVSAPMIGDPSGGLFALDATPTFSTGMGFAIDVWPARAFEFTPALLGPAISSELLSLFEDEGDWPSVVLMPVLEVRAQPPGDEDPSPTG